MSRSKFAGWVSVELKQHHAEQVAHERQSRFEFSVADPMGKLLRSLLMDKSWARIRKELQDSAGLKANDVAVYSLIAAALLMSQKLNTDRLAMNGAEKEELIAETLEALSTLKKNFKKIGKPDLTERLPEKEIKSALDVFDRLGKLGRQNNQNTARDVCCFALVSCFRSRFGKPMMPVAAAIVATLFDDAQYSTRTAEKACQKVEKAFTARPLKQGVDF